jgi:N-acetylglucosaminyl-diphospho-decaprenol L-rhamnosyltransferase
VSAYTGAAAEAGTIEMIAAQEQEVWTSSPPVIVPDSSAFPDVSICVVNWNCSEYLRALLSSIRSERGELIVEVIVVDNASTDVSASMVASEFPEVHLIRNDRHQGIARANNQAAAQARGKLLLFLNNDTRIRPGGLTTLVRFVERHPELSVAGPRLISPDGKPEGSVRKALTFRALLHRVLFLRWTRLFRSADREYRQLEFDLNKSGYVEQLVGAALLVRRQHLMSIGGWDENFEFHMDEVDLTRRLGRLGKMYYLAEAEVVHCGGIATRLDEVYAYRCSECSYIHYIRKHYGSWRARVYKVFITVDMPVRVFILTVTWVVKWLFGDRERALRNYCKLTAAGNFLVWGLPQYWRR